MREVKEQREELEPEEQTIMGASVSEVCARVRVVPCPNAYQPPFAAEASPPSAVGDSAALLHLSPSLRH